MTTPAIPGVVGRCLSSTSMNVTVASERSEDLSSSAAVSASDAGAEEHSGSRGQQARWGLCVGIVHESQVFRCYSVTDQGRESNALMRSSDTLQKTDCPGFLIVRHFLAE